MATDQGLHIIFALLASQLRERNVHHLNEEVGILFGEAQRWCYPKNVPVETTLTNQHSHIFHMVHDT